MSNYTITTDFGAKDRLPSGNAAKVIKGSEFSAEFTNIKTAVNSKADTVSPTFTGNTALNGTTTFGPDGTSTFNGTVNFTKDVTFDTNTMFIDVSENRVGIGNVAPATALDVTGTVTASGLTVDTTTLHVDATNNRVGIGTTSPTQNLHVYHATDNQIATFESGDNTSAIKIKDNVDETLIQNLGGVQQFVSNNTGAGTSGTRFLHGGSDVMRIASSGNVGIGTTSPATVLHVFSGQTDEGLRVESTDQNADIHLKDNGGSSYIRNSNGSLILEADRANSSNGTSTIFKLDNSEMMRINQLGNVGIGTNNPQESLHTAGNIRFGDTAPAELYTNSGELRLGVDKNNDNDASNITFYTNNNEKVRIEKDGNVGIGTTNPSRVLHVKGSNDTVRLESTGSNTKIEMVNTGSTTNEFGFKSNNFFVAPDGSERMRIDSSGNLLVGTTSTAISGSGSRFFSGGNAAITSAGTPFEINRLSAEGNIIAFKKDGAPVGSISVTSSATAYNTSSDERLKENITDSADAGSKIDAIQIRQFDWKADGSHQDYGVIAQELLEVAPEAVTEGETEDDMMSVDYSKLVPTLIKEVQTLRNRVAQLENN